MRVRLCCTNDDCQTMFDVDASATQDTAATCPACQTQRTMKRIDTPTDRGLTLCPCCDGDELYVRKDFPQKLGLVIVVLTAGISFYLFGRGQLFWSMGILVAMLLVDLVIYAVVSRITVCYRCRAEFRGGPINAQHEGFDLATAEKYR